MHMHSWITLNPARGRKLGHIGADVLREAVELDNLEPREGTETRDLTHHFKSPLGRWLDNLEPREGTETGAPSYLLIALLPCWITLNPARGRKLGNTLAVVRLTRLVG